jgi:allantoate deiminase
VTPNRPPAPPAADAAAIARTILDRCDLLAAFTEEPGRITRGYGSPALIEAISAAECWMREAGLETRRDAAGNLIGRLPAADPGAPVLLLGSHIDSVRDAGRYDGPLGVLLALAVAEHTAPGSLPFHLDVVCFADEEGLRFHTTYLGSRALAGCFDVSLLDRADGDGITLAEACRALGGDPDAVPLLTCPGGLLGYMEAHIEQGPALETWDAPLAVVTAIAGQTRIGLGFTGTAGHAGTVAMPLRRDALAAASEFVLATESLARATESLLATVGDLDVIPGASNVIAGETRLTLDVRSPDDAIREQAVATLRDTAREIAARRGLGHDWTLVQTNPATPMDSALTEALAHGIADSGHSVHRLPSGAGHDAVIMSTACPVAMLFIRCEGGISHNPAEAVTSQDVAAAYLALAAAVARLAETS